MNGQPSSHQVPKMHKLRLRAWGLPPFWLGVLTGFIPQTPAVVARMARFDPEPAWTKESVAPMH